MLEVEAMQRHGHDIYCFWCGFFTRKGGMCEWCGSPMIEHELSLLQQEMLGQASALHDARPT